MSGEREPAPLVACACTRVRRTSRALTQLYDEALAPSGLRVTQYAVLSKLSGRGPVPLGTLADELGMDRTTLTRTLARLGVAGLVGEAGGADRRMRPVRLTPAGEAALARARPYWRRAQERLTEKIGGERFEALIQELAAIEALVR